MGEAAVTAIGASARAWEVVLQHVEAQLVAGELRPGDHLPAERALAAELGVGRSSVREAIRVLEVLGLIRTQTGSGPQSGAIIIARPSGGMAALVRLQLAAHGFAVGDVVTTRVVLESAVVEQLAAAAGRASAGERDAGGDDESADRASDAAAAPDLAEALELLDAMEGAAGAALTRDEFLTLDQSFHRALATASGNAVIAAMMTGLRDSIEAYVRVGASFIDDWDATAERLRTEHRAVVAAIEAGDTAAARTRIRNHIETYHHETTVTGPNAR